MSRRFQSGMSATAALWLEFLIIGLGLFALILIFQPFSLKLFAIGSGLVVLAGLVNNLLPLAKPGVPLRTVITVAMVVAMIFCIVIVISVTAAHLYGVFFVKPPDPNTVTAEPFYRQPFMWSVAAIAAALAAIIARRNRIRR